MIVAEEKQQVDNDKPVDSMKSVPTLSPKLRKNKRIETRWGQKYYATIRDAVFIQRATPYMPPVPPPSIRDETEDCQPLYVCKQCGDCFHFLSSLEAHNSRRSWILGYWCQNCFLTDCSHMQSGQPPCFDCQAINRQRKTYLRAKGLRKGRKMGSTKIFYNQCQFYAHLNIHQTNIVDMADIMLMPIPLDVKKERYAELERLCETLLEHMFLTRTHVMDWLNSKQLGDKWWSLLQSGSGNNENLLAAMFKFSGRTRGDKMSEKYFAKPPKSSSTDGALPSTASPCSSSIAHSTSCNSSCSVSETIEAVIAQSACSDTEPLSETEDSETLQSPLETPLSSPRPIKASDNPCTTVDIAFVDCGQAGKTYPPHSVSLSPKDKIKIFSNGSINRSKSVNLATTKASSLLLSKISENPLEIDQTDNPDSAEPPGTASAANQGFFEPKITVKKFAHEHPTEPSVVINREGSSKSNNQTSQVTKELDLAPNDKLTGTKTFLASSTEGIKVVEKTSSNKNVTQTSLSSLGSKILTVHSSKNADLPRIIEHIPLNVINGKKIVLIGQDPERMSLLPKSETFSNLGMIKIPSETEKAMVIQTPPTEIAPLPASHNTNEKTVKIAPKPANNNISTDQMKTTMQQIYIDGKIIFKNGKKFVIRHTRKTDPVSTPNSLNNLKLQTVSKRVNLSSFLSKQRDPVRSFIPIAAKPLVISAIKPPPPPPPRPPTPPTPPTPMTPNASLSALLLRNVQKFKEVEYFSVARSVAGWMYIDFSKGKSKPIGALMGLSWQQILHKYKQQVSENMLHHGKERSKQLIQHLKRVNLEYPKIIGVTDDARISANLEAVEVLEGIFNGLPSVADQNPAPSNDDINEILLGFQETAEATVCSVCHKPAKSRSHIMAFPAASTTDLGCCRCNAYVCHICNVFQGNMSRLIGHLNLHAKRQPYSCPECLIKFPTMLELEIHIWTICFHLLTRRWFKCRICQVEGFLDIESLTKHFIIAHSKLHLGCSLCGLLLRSRSAFKLHCEAAHRVKPTSALSIHLSECAVGKYFVRLDQYRSCLDEHDGIIKMLYYKCPFCSFLVRETNRGKELIKHHLYNSHFEQLPELVSPESLPAIMLWKNSVKVKSQSQTEHIDSIKVQSDEISKCKVQDKADQVLDSSKIKRHNTGATLPESIVNNLQTDNQPPLRYSNAMLNKQTSEDGVKCNVRSMNLEQSESPQATDSKQKSSGGETPTRKAVNCNNVIAKYSVSPQICDVRSVTPDSYAEFEGTTKKRIYVKSGGRKGALELAWSIPKTEISEAFVGVNISDKPNQTIVPKSELKDPVLVKLEKQMLPVKLPQVIVVNQADANINSTGTFQSSMTDSNMFIERQEATFNKKTVKENSEINSIELAADEMTDDDDEDDELTDEKVDVLKTESPIPVIKTVFTLAPPTGSEESEETTGVNTLRTELRGSVEKEIEQLVDDKKLMQQVPFLRVKSNSTLKMPTNIVTESNRVSDLEVKTTHDLQAMANSSDNNEEHLADRLLRDVSKPPPLARIPRLTEASRLQVPLEVKEESREVGPTELKSSAKLKRRRGRPRRIALNAPLGTSESIDYHCHLCDAPINTSWPVIRSHFSSRHSEDYKLSIVTPRLLRMSSEFVTSGYKDIFASRKRKFDSNVPGSKRRKRWSPKKHVEKYSLDLGLCVEQASLQDGEGKFICKKCDERCDDISSLRTHIGTNHRIKDHYLVCLECGENFVVEPSLQMHLKVFHSIRDPCNYLAENGAYAKELIEMGESEPKTSIANQCHVCMAVFEDKSAVDKHLRVHGMAFLNRKRIEARIAARNPEKKIRIDKPDNNSTLSSPESDQTEKREIDRTKTNDGMISQLGKAEIERPCQDKSVE